MGVSFQLEEEILRFTTVGGVDYVEGIAVLQKGFAEAAGAGARRHVLFDIRESTENRSSEELRNIAEALSPFRDRMTGLVAIVVSKPVYFGTGRQFAVYADKYDITVNVFREVAEAEAWFRN